MTEMKPIMTTRELAEYLGKKPATITQWRYYDIGPAWSKKGHRTVWYHAADVQAWLDEQQRGTPPGTST